MIGISDPHRVSLPAGGMIRKAMRQLAWWKRCSETRPNYTGLDTKSRVDKAWATTIRVSQEPVANMA
jgi:hypothetical protein